MRKPRKAWWCGAGLVAAGLWAQPGAARAETPQEPARAADTLPPPKMTTPADAPAPSIAPLIDSRVQSIDLASVLRLAGARNPEILLARERVVEAVALRQLAAAQFLPTLNAGTNFNNHTGPLQTSTGVIQKVDRGSLYLGLGANAVGAGTVNIPGLVLSGNVSEGIFAALSSRQVVRQREYASQAVQNDVLLRVALAYLELLRAEGRRAIAVEVRGEAAEVSRVTTNFAKKGIGQERQADADRAQTEYDQRVADVLQAEADVMAASARLVQLLGLDPTIRLRATDCWVVPAPIVPDPIPLPELIAISLTQRPELGERQAAIRAALLELRGAKVLPFSPNVILGYSAGTFGGGSNLASAGIVQPDGSVLHQARFDSFAPREDFDAVVYWSLRNLGVGNLALVRLAQSNLRTEDLRRVEVLDRIRAEVATAYARTHARFAQIDSGERAVRAGQKAFQEDLNRTRNIVKGALPIEVLDSFRLLARSRYLYLDSIVDYNRAQFELYVALGRPPADYLARPVPADLVPPPTTEGPGR
jgi:outer membrane protein TolC